VSELLGAIARFLAFFTFVGALGSLAPSELAPSAAWIAEREPSTNPGPLESVPEQPLEEDEADEDVELAVVGLPSIARARSRALNGHGADLGARSGHASFPDRPPRAPATFA
jgi:hypothetical protein